MRFTITISAEFPSKAKAKSALLELNDFHNDAKLKVESIEAKSAKPKPQAAQSPPNGFVFLFDDEGSEEDSPRFFVTPIEFWRKNWYIDDSLKENQIPVPAGFRVCQEALLEYEGDYDEALDLLKKAGFQEVQWGEKSWHY